MLFAAMQESLILARNGHGPMSDLSPLSGEEQKSNFGAARSVDDPEQTLSQSGMPGEGRTADPVVPWN